jgi:hypothetical protein
LNLERRDIKVRSKFIRRQWVCAVTVWG